jgi:hypothetical protein
LNELLPGIEDYYGPNVPMNIHFNVTSVGNIEITEANQEMGGDVTMITQWWVENSPSDV